MTPIRLAIPTMTLGRAWVHELDVKLAEAGKAGFDGVEVFWEDLVYAARKLFQHHADSENIERDEAAMLGAAKYAREQCDANGLVVLVLQPFMNYEGLLDQAAHDALIVKLHLWFKVIKVLGTDMIQIPSQMYEEGTTGDVDRIVADLREVAELGLQQDPPVRFAYEALSWGAYIDRWEQAWDIVSQVDRPNFGTVLDTYHILARIYGDPTASSGLQPNAEDALSASLASLARTPGLSAKLFYLQLSDAERLSPPLSRIHPFFDPAQKPNMQWSRNARLFPCEGYLPVERVARAVLGDPKLVFDSSGALGWRGWVSLEVFSRTMCDPATETPRVHAARGMHSWKTLISRMSTLVTSRM